MNPNAGSGTPLPPNEPTPQPLSDIPEDAFGFADDTPASRPVQARPIFNQPGPAVLPPVQPQNPPRPTPPAPAPQPIAPAAAPLPPTTPTPQPVIMPPQTIPTVPVVPPQPITPAPPAPPVASPQPPTQPPAIPQPSQVPLAPTAPQPPKQTGSFDPSKVPVHAWSTSENPITASYSPAQTTHLPEDIAKRIGEHPIQNSEDVLRMAKHGFDIHRIKSVLSFLVFTAGIFLAAFLINQFVFQSYYVEGTSMVPTLQNNDRLIISKVERTWAGLQGQPYIPERGQIVVLDSSIVGINGQKEQLIKRVIGLPGDNLHIEGGIVTITNTEHPDGYDVTAALGLTNLQPTFSESPIDIIVPAGQVYVMGDNREQGGSHDSRMFGPVDGNKIQGRLWARILPLDKAQTF